jgi:hypothetical protein
VLAHRSGANSEIVFVNITDSNDNGCVKFAQEGHIMGMHLWSSDSDNSTYKYHINIKAPYLKHFCRLLSCSDSGQLVLRGIKDHQSPIDDISSTLCSFPTSKPVSRMRISPDCVPNMHSRAPLQQQRLIVALGGEENDLQLWDILSQKQIWKAKNVNYCLIDLMLLY